MMAGRDGHALVLSQVIGDVLPHFTPTTEFRVHCDGRMICNGFRLRPSQVAARPRVEVGGPDFRSFFTLSLQIMVDADAPSPGNPYLREYLHWLVTDIPGSTGPAFGNEIMSYEGPQPTMGIHRLVLVLFRQPGRQSMTAPEWRQNFNIRQFSEANNLGSPVAALYYNCNRENGTGCRRPP